VNDLIDRIDALTTPTCGHCQRPLHEDGPSADFCGETCAELWRSQGGNHDEPWYGHTLRHVNAMVERGEIALSPADVGGRPIASDIGRPWIRSPITPPPTGVLIGGQRHGHTIGTANPPCHTIDVIEEDPNANVFLGDPVHCRRVAYHLKGHNGVHWCYVSNLPAAPSRTVQVAGREPLTIDYHHLNVPCDRWWVTITGRRQGVVCELPNELLTHDQAISAWFAERGRTTSDGIIRVLV